MNPPLLKVLAAGPGVVLGGSFESLLIGGQPTLVTRALWVDNFSATGYCCTTCLSAGAATPMFPCWRSGRT